MYITKEISYICALEFSLNDMRYVTLRFTYLLTYLLTSLMIMCDINEIMHMVLNKAVSSNQFCMYRTYNAI